MSIVLKCTCGKLLDVDEQHHGERGQCPWCGNQFVVGEVILSTTAVQAEALASKLVLHESTAETRANADNDVADPKIALPRLLHPAVWPLIFVIVLGAGAVLVFHLSQPFVYAKQDIARTTIKGILTPACDAFQIKRGRFPKNLEELLEKDALGGPFLNSPEYLVDPWGRPYRYDRAGPRNNALVPDISFIAPDGSEIGNWPKGR